MGPKLKPRNSGPMDKFLKQKTANQKGESCQSPDLQPVAEKKTANQNGETSQPPVLQPVAEPCVKPESSPVCAPPLAQSQGLSPVPCGRLDKQEEEPHATHSFEWCGTDNKFTTFTCNKAGTVEGRLTTSSQFREMARKNQNKELVIMRDGKAISSHFPCILINQNEQLTVKYVKAVGKPKKLVSPRRRGPPGDLVILHLLTKGGKNVANIMTNPVLKTDIQEITVYACKGDTVKQALRRDGRFLKTIFKKNCALSHTRTGVTTEMSSIVDDLDGKSFQIIRRNKSSQPESQPGSLDDAYMTPTESQISDCTENQNPPQQSTTTESVNDNTPKEKEKLNDNEAPEIMWREIPNSKKAQKHLFSKFQQSVKGKKTHCGSKLSRIQNVFRVDYGKNDQTCREVKTLKELMNLSNSVCQVRINERAGGSGFLLFGKFVLTNGHVIKNLYESRRQLNEKVTVHFSFESLNQTDSGAEVEEVVGFEYCRDVSERMYDWALLKLRTDQKLPDGLLTHFGFLPQSGGICIIGHPDGGVKKIDPCFIIPTENYNLVVEKHRCENPFGVLPENCNFSENQEPIQLITHRFFDGVTRDVLQQSQTLNYESCFYYGSSGSPVFDEHCNVVAMHSGGYAYRNARDELHSVIEFGYPLSLIIEHIVVQMVGNGRVDVLKEYLACNYARRHDVMTNLKRLVESRNLPVFKNAANNLVVKDDDSLKEFFEFFSQIEEPVPMDTGHD